MNKLIELIESFHLFATKYLLQKVVEFVEFFFLQTLIDKTINR